MDCLALLELDSIARGYRALDLLVATTVIEVGVDVPNASLMVIENAERMGLAQLHQLRGRVGRGQQASSCVLLYQPPLSPLARDRLQTLRSTNDGFWFFATWAAANSLTIPTSLESRKGSKLSIPESEGATGGGGQSYWWQFSRCENSGRAARAVGTGAAVCAALRIAAQAVPPS